MVNGRLRSVQSVAASPRALPGLFLLTLLVFLTATAGAAIAAEPPDPPSNIPIGQLPASCSIPTSAGCENAVIYYLDEARGDMGLPPYPLPVDFPQLAADRQIFILSDLDRAAYSLQPVEGLNTELSQSAAEGVATGDDPYPGSWAYRFNAWYSNWAGAFVNAPDAYYEWMYNDGYGSGNLACESPSDGGCWGHRHNILGQPGDESNPYQAAMGAATGREARSGAPGYAMLILTASPGFEPQPPYYYTWAEAQADGAGTNRYDPGVPDLSIPTEPTGSLRPSLRLIVRGKRLRIVADPVLLGRRVTVTVRREVVPCAIHRRASRCTWVGRGPLQRFGLVLSRHTAIRARPSAWERIAVHARVSGFEADGQRYAPAGASVLLLGPKPRRSAR